MVKRPYTDRLEVSTQPQSVKGSLPCRYQKMHRSPKRWTIFSPVSPQLLAKASRDYQTRRGESGPLVAVSPCTRLYATQFLPHPAPRRSGHPPKEHRVSLLSSPHNNWQDRLRAIEILVDAPPPIEAMLGHSGSWTSRPSRPRFSPRNVDKTGCISFEGPKDGVGVTWVGQTVDVVRFGPLTQSYPCESPHGPPPSSCGHPAPRSAERRYPSAPHPFL